MSETSPSGYIVSTSKQKSFLPSPGLLVWKFALCSGTLVCKKFGRMVSLLLSLKQGSRSETNGLLQPCTSKCHIVLLFYGNYVSFTLTYFIKYSVIFYNLSWTKILMNATILVLWSWCWVRVRFSYTGHKAKEECMFCHGRILKLWVPQYFNGQTLPN